LKEKEDLCIILEREGGTFTRPKAGSMLGKITMIMGDSLMLI